MGAKSLSGIKALVCGLSDWIVRKESDLRGSVDEAILGEFTHLIHFARSKEIEPVLFANHAWKVKGQPVEQILQERWGQLRSFSTIRDNLPKKPQAAAMKELLRRLNCTPNEVLYVGNSENDMRTAVNGNVLFLNGTWIRDAVDYGFKFSSPKEIAKFIDVFCCRDHAWAFSIATDSIRYFALAPFSTYLSAYQDYSEDARRSAKDGTGHPEFWGRYVTSTLFLTGLYTELNYVAPFPSHTAHCWKDPIRLSLETFAKCFRARYLPDLVQRHTTVLSSRHHKQQVNHLTHLNSISLNKCPAKGERSTYKTSPLKPGKTVLIVDDFCTRGQSLEAARINLQATGANVVMISWLKTINTDYQQVTTARSLDPYTPTQWREDELQVQTHPYSSALTDETAASELRTKLQQYGAWDWPPGIQSGS